MGLIMWSLIVFVLVVGVWFIGRKRDRRTRASVAHLSGEIQRVSEIAQRRHVAAFGQEDKGVRATLNGLEKYRDDALARDPVPTTNGVKVRS